MQARCVTPWINSKTNSNRPSWSSPRWRVRPRWCSSLALPPTRPDGSRPVSSLGRLPHRLAAVVAADLTLRRPAAAIRVRSMRRWARCPSWCARSWDRVFRCLAPVVTEADRGELCAAILLLTAPTEDPQVYLAMHMGKIQGFPGLSLVCESVDFETALRLSNPGRRRTKEEKECLY